MLGEIQRMGLQQSAGRDCVLSIENWKLLNQVSKEIPIPRNKTGFQNGKFSVEFRRVRISLTFDTWFSNVDLHSIDSAQSLQADCWSPRTFAILNTIKSPLVYVS